MLRASKELVPAPEGQSLESSAVYLDCNATTPLDPEVLDEVVRYLAVEYGNSGSRTHEFGLRAKTRVDQARAEVASLVAAEPDEVVFTSGATESNNLAILGAVAPDRSRAHHVITTRIEHKAVLEPADHLAKTGADLTIVPSTAGGWVDPDDIRRALRPYTVLVSVMHVNNETGVVQPIDDIATALSDHPTLFHVDAAQGFGKELAQLRNRRIDLISISGHKIYAPKGVGALIARKRGFTRPQLAPLMFGGGQERGLRPGTLPVALIAGLGTASALAQRNHGQRAQSALRIREAVLETLAEFHPVINGDAQRTLPHVLNVSLPGLDSEAVMLALKGVVAISNGSACTSRSYEPSHVLRAMGLSDDVVRGALRLSWSHLTPDADWVEIASRIRALK